MCKKYVDKYQLCTQKRYKQAQALHAKLKPEERKRSAPLLQTLKQQLTSPTWHKRHMKMCLQKPPSNKRFRCVYRSACGALSRCNPDLPPAK